MRPMYNTSFFVPFVFTRELNGIAFSEGTDSRGDVNIVCDQKCLAGTKGNDEPLMPAADIVVCQQSCDDPLAGDLKIALVI